MNAAPTARDRWIWLASAGLMAFTIGLELVVPLGYAVWLTYFIAVGVTLFQRRLEVPLLVAAGSCILLVVGYHLAPASTNSAFSFVNRTIGGICFLLMALTVIKAIQARRTAADALWLQEGENAVTVSLRGDPEPRTLADEAMRTLCAQLNADVGAVYRLQGERLVLVGGAALPPHLPESLMASAGQWGEVLRQGQPRRLEESESLLEIETALGRTPVHQRLLGPITADGAVIGLIELGRAGVSPARSLELELLLQCAEPIGMALRTALLRAQLVELLEETQRQSEELQTQQEELRVANEELEEQSRSLLHSQANLEQQQAELEQTNVQLEERTHELESRQQALLIAQGQLVQNSRELEASSRYKSEFLANMSHELRTPLNSALILAKLLADNKDGTLTAEQVKYAQAIHSSNNDLLALINDILDLSRIEAGHVELAEENLAVSSVLQRLKETFEPLAAQKGLALDIRADTDAPSQLVADGQRLQQILKNLLANAVKFTEHGSVSLVVRGNGAGRIQFAVTDTGIGIPQAQTDVIFEAFRQADGSTRRRYGGTGLGLSISRELARLLGGRITLESRVGEGSVFTLTLPRAYDAAQVPPRETPAPAPHVSPQSEPPPERRQSVSASIEDDRDHLAGTRRLLLVVEDDDRFAAIVRDLSRELGFQCIVAGTAQEALKLAKRHRPSAVVLDVGLPDQSGLTVLDVLKRDDDTRHIPIHVVSAEDHSQTALSLGAIGYLVKPVKREDLAEVLRTLEETLTRTVRRVLIVEDDLVQRDAVSRLLASGDVETVGVGTAAECLEQLRTQTFDCMVLDLTLPDASGFSLLETLSREGGHGFPPVIVYTGRDLSPDHEQQLRRYSSSIIIKGAKSPERLLDEVSLFLHQVVSELPPEQQKMIRKARNRDAVLEGRRILIVEDDVRNVYSLTNVLEPRGALVEIARNGKEALEALEQASTDPSKAVDLVLMDVMMPVMDGLTATREMRKDPRWKTLPVLMLTAKAMPDDQERCMAAGANDYMAKPLDVDKLLSLVRVWMPR